MERCETILYTRWHLVFIHNIVLIQIMIDRIRVFIGHFFLVIDWHGRMILQVDKIKTKWMDPNSLKRTTWVKIKLYRITNIPNSIRFYLWLKKNQIFSQTFLFNEAPNFELRNSVHTAPMIEWNFRISIIKLFFFSEHVHHFGKIINCMTFHFKITNMHFESLTVQSSTTRNHLIYV